MIAAGLFAIAGGTPILLWMVSLALVNYGHFHAHFQFGKSGLLRFLGDLVEHLLFIFVKKPKKSGQKPTFTKQKWAWKIAKNDLEVLFFGQKRPFLVDLRKFEKKFL